MSDVLLRQWQMLQFIPRAPRKVGTATLETSLKDRGFDVDRRTIQRDLVSLSATVPLVCDDHTKPFGWSWMADGVPLEVPNLDLHVALAS